MQKRFGFFVMSMILLLISTAVNAQTKNWWCTVSFDFATPFTGMTLNSNTYFPNIYGNKSAFLDMGLGISGGYTPWHLSPTIGFGFMGKVEISVALANYGSFSISSPYYGTLPVQSYFYLGSWIGFSPMGVFRFQIGRDSYINLGVGPSFWKYTDMGIYTLNAFGYAAADAPLSSFDGTSGVSPAVYSSISFGWFIIELGLTGPDFFAGLGVSF